MRRAIVILCLGLASLVAVGCGRFSPVKSYVAQTSTDPASAYAKVLKVLAERGYHIVEQRDGDRYVQVRAHIDENFADRQSFISAQVDPAGAVTLTPSGHLVRGDKVHKKLATELDDIENAVRANPAPESVVATASASDSPLALPPAPPPPPSAAAASGPAPVSAPASAASSWADWSRPAPRH